MLATPTNRQLDLERPKLVAAEAIEADLDEVLLGCRHEDAWRQSSCPIPQIFDVVAGIRVMVRKRSPRRDRAAKVGQGAAKGLGVAQTAKSRHRLAAKAGSR